MAKDVYEILRESGYVTQSQAGDLEDDILNWFEARTCESCKHSIAIELGYQCDNDSCPLNGDCFHNGFGCNKFEPKEKR